MHTMRAVASIVASLVRDGEVFYGAGVHHRLLGDLETGQDLYWENVTESPELV